MKAEILSCCCTCKRNENYARSVFIIILVIWVIFMMAFFFSFSLLLTAEAKRHFKRYEQGCTSSVLSDIFSFSPSLTISDIFFFWLFCTQLTVCHFLCVNMKKKYPREKKSKKKFYGERTHKKRGLTRRLYCYVYAYDIILIILF